MCVSPPVLHRSCSQTHRAELEAKPALFNGAVVDHAEYERVLNSLIHAEEARAEAESTVVTMKDT